MNRNRANTPRIGRSPFHGLAVAVLLALAGCGPGVGGSGTGPDLASFGATAAPVCSAPFASALGCSMGMATPELPGATGAVQFVDLVNGSQVVATPRGGNIELDLRCPRLYFYGSWGTTAAGVSRYFGGYSSGGGLPLSPAQLTAAPDAAAPGGLVVQLLDASGAALTAPLRLRPATGLVTGVAVGCP